MNEDMKRKYVHRNRAYTTNIPKEVAKFLKLEEVGELQWTITKRGVVTVKKVENN